MSLHLPSFNVRMSYDHLPDEILGPKASKKEQHCDTNQQNLMEYPPEACMCFLRALFHLVQNLQLFGGKIFIIRPFSF